MSMGRKQKFFEWTELQFPSEVYQARRQAMLRLLPADAVMLIPSRHGPDSGTFRQNDNFNYFTGLELPESILAIDAKEGICLYVPHTDLRFSSPVRPNDFPGRDLYDDPELKERSGLEKMLPFEEFEPMLDKIGQRPVYLPMPDRKPLTDLTTKMIFHWDTEQGFAYHLMHNTKLHLQNGFEFISRLRLVKGPEEIEALRTAVNITEDSILATLPLVKPGVDERTLIGKLEYEYRKRGSQRVAFDSIVKGGLNSHCAWRILGSHYDRRNQVLKENEVVVFDVGAERDYYVSDIGRTFPVGERFTPLQYDALRMVEEVVEAIKASIRPGILLGDLREVALKTLPSEHHPFMQVDSYYGHHIGLSTGDPAMLELPLQKGMVFTIEPWYYNHRDHVSVFTEENIAVTENGVDVLSAKIPIDPASLEKLRRGEF